MPLRVPDPPSGITGPLRDYLAQLAKALNSVPTFSWFSGTTPESVLTGQSGDFAMNRGSATTVKRLFVKAGPDDPKAYSKVSWAVVSVTTLS